MGVVYLAEQEYPVRRRVALKIIKPGMDSAGVIARFELERQALALMDHPSIAKVFDGGTTLSGRPFFAMELVQGIPITQYCDSKRLTLTDRLKLFLPLCQAIQHAHQKGVIHRDIKPSNVLVAVQDGTPVPKVIDFGVAKALHQNLTDKTVFTQFGTVMGTLEYMSPEQVEADIKGIDTRADIYSLGVLLYQLLSGNTPLDGKQLREEGFAKILSAIRELEPPRPSTRLSALGDAGTSIGTLRQTDSRKLCKLLAGDLDLIVMKCLEKDRSRRYESASGLGRDIQRYLSDEPVEASPPSRMYRLRKFSRKHRIALTTTVGFILLLVAGTTLSVWQAVRATNARNSEAAQRQLADRATTRAVEAAQKETAERKGAQALSNLLVGIFRQIDPRAEEKNGLDFKTQLITRIESAASRLDKDYADQALTKARLQSALGISEMGLDNGKSAEGLLTEALETYQKLTGEESLETASAMHDLALGHLLQGHSRSAVNELEQTRKIQRGKLAADDPRLLETEADLAGAYRLDGNAPKAIEMLEEVVKKRKAIGPNNLDTLKAMGNLAVAYTVTERAGEAIPLLQVVYEQFSAQLGEDNLDTLIALGNLATAMRFNNRVFDAFALSKKSQDALERKLGPNHRATITMVNNLGELYLTLHNLKDAIPLLERASAQLAINPGPDHPLTLKSMQNLALAYLEDSRTDKAIEKFRIVLSRRNDTLGPTADDTLDAAHGLAYAYLSADQPKDAIPLLKQVRKALVDKHPPGHPFLLFVTGNLGAAYLMNDQAIDAIEPLETTYDQRRDTLGDDNSETRIAAESLMTAYLRTGKYTKALPLISASLATREDEDPENWITFNAKSMLGGCLLGLGEIDEAESYIISGYNGLKAQEKDIPPQYKPRVAEALEPVIDFYQARGQTQ